MRAEGSRPLAVRSGMLPSAPRIGQLMPGARLRVLKLEAITEQGLQCACVMLRQDDNAEAQSWRALYAHLPDWRARTWRDQVRQLLVQVLLNAPSGFMAVESEFVERMFRCLDAAIATEMRLQRGGVQGANAAGDRMLEPVCAALERRVHALRAGNQALRGRLIEAPRQAASSAL